MLDRADDIMKTKGANILLGQADGFCVTAGGALSQYQAMIDHLKGGTP